MKPNLRPIAVVLIALVVASGHAADPPVGAVGKVLLLDNQRVLEGVIERVGDQYRIRRDGGETLIPANRVLAVCADLNAAYRHLLERTDPRDAVARLRLARWCDANGLRSEAVAEAQAAVELQPRSTEAQALLKLLRQKAAAPAPVSVPVKPVVPVAHAVVADPIDCGTEAFQRFATKIQPVLANTCVSCHAGENAGPFRLVRTYANGLNGPMAVQQNLAAALAQIDREKPLASPLLQQATAAHGGATVPPLRDRGMAAYQHLEEWVKMIADEALPIPTPVAPAIVTAAYDPAVSVTKPDAGPKTEFGAGNAPSKDEITDPFDPAIFNRQHHPEGAKPTPPPQ